MYLILILFCLHLVSAIYNALELNILCYFMKYKYAHTCVTDPSGKYLSYLIEIFYLNITYIIDEQCFILKIAFNTLSSAHKYTAHF